MENQDSDDKKKNDDDEDDDGEEDACGIAITSGLDDGDSMLGEKEFGVQKGCSPILYVQYLRTV